MRLTFHGAAQTVTGSQHLLEINGSKLHEAGMPEVYYPALHSSVEL
jgi:hypothetical protein